MSIDVYDTSVKPKIEVAGPAVTGNCASDLLRTDERKSKSGNRTKKA